tara:strand:- start:484 stop:1212 length:729 start_codon:yes stop_codon:yes gene_type:complete
MTSFNVNSHIDIRNSLKIQALYPYLATNVRTKLKKYKTVEKLLVDIHEHNCTLDESEELTVIDEILRIDKNLINFFTGTLKNKNLTYLSNNYDFKSFEDENNFLLNQLKNISSYTKTESLINSINNSLIGLDTKLIFLNFVNAQLVNFIKSTKKTSSYLRRIKKFDTTKGFNYFKEEVDLISLPLFAHIEIDFEKEIIEFLKNINEFGITNTVHLISLNDETLKFINRIDSKLLFNLNRVLN